MRCPIQSRAIEGAFAAERLADVKQAFESYRQDWQAFHRAFDEAGDNYRAAHEMELHLADEIMFGLFGDYRAAVAAEHICINMERKAA
jgi:hypothetical protein